MTPSRYTKLRLLIFRVLALAAFATIMVRLAGLQMVSSEQYKASADRNRFRLIPIDAPRGIIYDRYGRLLVRNVPSFVVNIVPGALPKDPQERRAVLARVGELLDMPVGAPPTAEGEDAENVIVRGAGGPSIEGILHDRMVGAFSPVRIASDVDRRAAFVIEEEHLDLPGVLVEVESLRSYADGPLTSHILGYVGPIPRERLDYYVDNLDQDYEPDDLVGLTGIERTQESILRGIKGQKHIEVDAFERQVNVIAATPPERGHSVMLTIDVGLQQVVEEALREGMRAASAPVGVVVAMDPRTGEILSMVSLPSYDNNLFSGGISYADYARLSSERHHPLMNHSITGQYPPGSTFKIVPACAGLQEGIVDNRTTFVCHGTMLLPNKLYPNDLTKAQTFYCWNRHGHGALNVQGAVQHSCDIYFYQVAGGYREFKGLGIARLAEYARTFGFDEPTGVELSGEAGGLVPTDQWKRQTFGENWLTGDTYNAAIGQGFVLATPLQVLNATVAVANGGTLYRPQLVYQVLDTDGQVVDSLVPDVIRDVGISPENMAIVRQGMRDAVTQGTAWALGIPEITVAGKTGTAEYPGVDEGGNLILDEEGHLPTHAWFTAFAPFEDPEICLVVFLEGGGEGSTVAVPVAGEILRYYFGLPKPQIKPTATAPTPPN